MQTITVSSKNQIVIPRAVRTRLGIGPADKLVVGRVTDKEVVLQKEPTYHELIGTLPTQKQDPVKRIRNLRDNWE
jgi:AbrB family looped-hinge helix DNA binding protein